MDGVGMITTVILLSSIPTNSSASSVSQDLCGNGTSVLHCRLIVVVWGLYRFSFQCFSIHAGTNTKIAITCCT